MSLVHFILHFVIFTLSLALAITVVGVIGLFVNGVRDAWRIVKGKDE